MTSDSTVDVDVSDRLAVAREAATSGGERALEDFRGDLEVSTKNGPTDLVTETDRLVQSHVREVLESAYPDEPIVGEENDAPGTVPASGPAWIVDPIDGTNNFVRGSRAWTTAVAAVVDGEPVAAAIAAPAHGDVYAAGSDRTTLDGDPVRVSDRDRAREATICPTLWWPHDRREEFGAVVTDAVATFADCRRFGSTQLELALVATGALDAAVATGRAAPWDTVAGVHLIRRAGGTVTDAGGDRWRHDAVGLVASNGGVHDEALGCARAGGSRHS